MGFSPSSKVCVNTAPRPYEEASHCTTNCREKSGEDRIGAEMSSSFTRTKAEEHSSVHENGTPLRVNCARGAITEAK
ncbi:hypothetical protein GEV33_006203 [Tenebrio molitor]|uniref:Uncharacterized protein n=1 Tax=Tenebrio molitor TaxID=7067 RepID=A0A8J6HN35_TENMO|nr:hypothetical protein GEV33_006203 [Tenebrio molitor]